ncbi:MAG: FAD:protein FMN transferase [Lachnospiraceae bacterium]|nr:FAD:protein FMN transferase [Lachnospiraceae bacterium]MDD3660816.1 FAD:protein FMN transferase [Lachnospiraceae bacterium]
MKRVVTIITVIAMIFNLTACGSKAEQRFESSFLELFDTVTTIVGYAPDEKTFTEYSQMIYDRLEEYHQLYDIYHDYEGVNNIKTINDNAGIRPVKVDQKIIDLLEFSIQADQLTNDNVNIAFGSVLSIWHDYRTIGIDDPLSAELPPTEELQEMAKHTDISNVKIDKEASTVYLEDPLMKLDVGAIAKGYATEMTANYIIEQGFINGMISVGGNVRTIGTKFDDAGSKIPWSVGIQNPDQDSTQPTVHILQLEDMSLVTSGVYERYYTVDGKRYHHIIDPETLMPSELFQSVSIVCKDSGMADALSTSIFNMTLEEGKELIESLEDTEAFWILKDGTYEYSTGFETYIRK